LEASQKAWRENFQMTNSTPEPSSDSTDGSAARANALLGGAVLLTFAVLFVIGQIAVAHDRLLVPRRVGQWKRQGNAMYVDRRFYLSEADQLLFDDLPKADYSKGGVYFTGASVMRRLLMMWDWPAEDQKRVHNYCVCSAHSHQQELFTRYLIDQQNLLSAGGGKTVIFLELSPFHFRDSQTPEDHTLDRAWISWFQRPGLFRLEQDRIHDDDRFPGLREARIADLKSSAFFNWLLNFVHLGQPGEIVEPASAVYGDAAIAEWNHRLGPNWRAPMDRQLADFGRFIDYLQSKQVIVVGLYMPEPSWFENFEPATYFRSRVLPLLAAKSVDVVDLRRVIDDAGFCDSHHLNYSGSVKIQPYLIAAAEKYLRKIDEQTPRRRTPTGP
jgi:hypothetical protein